MAGTGRRNCNFLYFMHNTEGKRVKIGISSNPRIRLQQLQGIGGYKLDLIFVYEDDPVYIFFLESRLHDKFFHQKITGEWFQEEKVLEFLADLRVTLPWCRNSNLGVKVYYHQTP